MVDTKELWKLFITTYFRNIGLYQSMGADIHNRVFIYDTILEAADVERWDLLEEKTWNLLIGIIPEYAIIRLTYV